MGARRTQDRVASPRVDILIHLWTTSGSLSMWDRQKCKATNIISSPLHPRESCPSYRLLDRRQKMYVLMYWFINHRLDCQRKMFFLSIYTLLKSLKDTNHPIFSQHAQLRCSVWSTDASQHGGFHWSVWWFGYNLSSKGLIERRGSTHDFIAERAVRKCRLHGRSRSLESSFSLWLFLSLSFQATVKWGAS